MRLDTRPTDAEADLEADEAGRYRAFVDLLAESCWELDADLRYVFRGGRAAACPEHPLEGTLGRSRIAELREVLGAGPELDEHDRLLLAREPLDLVLPLTAPDGNPRWTHVIAEPRFDASGRFLGYLGCEREVSEHVRLRERLARMATHDELTGLVNRRGFRERLEALQARVAADPAAEHALCMVDLDRFKLVNDTAGHAAGDRLLRTLATTMTRFVMPTETLARLGGDEFALLLCCDVDAARRRMEGLIEAVSTYEFDAEGYRFSVGASVGITPIVPGEGGELLDRADSACYRAKADGRNRCVVLAPDSADYLAHRKEIEQIDRIKEALRADRLRLLMQKIEPAEADEAGPGSHNEILLRLESESGELMLPATFIPVAERFNMMQDLDRWVLEHSLEALAAFRAIGEPLSLSINLSGNTLSDRGCLEHICRVVRDAGTDPALLCFEITETTAIGNIDAVVAFMRELGQDGVHFALDDFGAGLSSFAYIRSLPIDYLKIDGYFIRNIRSDATNRAITAAFIRLSRELGIATVAESVEDKATRRAVAAMGIDCVQGYGVSRPVDLGVALERARRTREPRRVGER